jgi:hypothetical protein
MADCVGVGVVPEGGVCTGADAAGAVSGVGAVDSGRTTVRTTAPLPARVTLSICGVDATVESAVALRGPPMFGGGGGGNASANSRAATGASTGVDLTGGAVGWGFVFVAAVVSRLATGGEGTFWIATLPVGVKAEAASGRAGSISAGS